ncbi:uncharacterized protein LOC117169728 [Belonocnema kinseyi]|uniref:uncharacterized protein LOC117169728 n=1 Tax=Belonocnema kinseyi TaxID=2817044 RepID=UPI00143DC697|nr:uncharacterized protein LOC117169728 [Belonocnema kinseyi]
MEEVKTWLEDHQLGDLVHLFEHKTVFPLFLYFDDVEPDNQTGSHSRVHSLGAVYYEVACLPQHLLSSLENIFVAAFFLSDDRHLNNGKAFADILNDLKDLETNGITIQTEAGDQRIHFALCLLLADNLGFHSITGLVESFSANFFCRFCKQHRLITQSQKREDPQILRNIQNYEMDVLNNDCSLTGVKSNCIWNVLSSFHITINQYLDFMHDFLEGVCHYDLCAILDQIISFDGFLSIDTLNERVQYFDYGPDSGNKPSMITMNDIKKDKMKMNASEMFFFCRNLGLMVGHLVPEGDDSWKLYVALNEILSIISAPVVHQNSTDYLVTLIAEHHELYLKVCGTTLKPKHHFMLHYPRIRNLIGPLINVWCMRLDRKHRPIIKLSSKNTTCRKNLPLTIAKKYALTLCARLFSQTGFPKDFQSVSKECRILDCEDYLNFRFLLPDGHENLMVFKKATFLDISYKSGMALAYNYYEENLPLFGILRWIVEPEDNIGLRFILSVLHTVGFSDHLQCYEVKPTEVWFIQRHDSLVSFYPSFPRTGADGTSYITFKHCL